MYSNMIWSLVCLTTCTQNIVFNLCTHFEEKLGEIYLIVVKIIFHYLKHTTNLCLCFKGWENFKLQGSCDVGYTLVEVATSLVET